MFELKLFLPSQEVLNSNRCERSKLWSLKHLFDFLFNFEISLIGSSLYQEVNNPEPDLFDNIIDDGFIPILVDDIFDEFSDLVKIIPGDTSHRFDLILDRCFRVGFGILKVNIELILVLMLW